MQCSVSLPFTSCDTSISEYKPKSGEEKRIIALLTTFADGRNRGGLEAIHAAFYDDGTCKPVRGGRIAKSRIPDTQPQWWTTAGVVKLKNPGLQVEDNRANDVVTAKHGAHFTAATVFTCSQK